MAWRLTTLSAIIHNVTHWLISTRLGADINIAPEVKQATVRLREVEALGRVHRIHKGQFPRIPEGHADRAVLVARALRVERRRVVVEGLPVARVVVPVEARASRLRLEAEEVAHFFLDLLIRLRAARVLRDEVRALVPGLPFRSWTP